MPEPSEADLVRPDVRRFLDYLDALPGPQQHEMPPAEARRQMRAYRDLIDREVGELAVIEDVTGPGDAGIRLRLYDARADRLPGPVMIYIHGGGFVLGDLDTYEPVCAEIARVLDIPVVSVDYRLAPEHPFPAAPDDCEAGVRWIAANMRAFGRAATGVVLAGDSAGGMLAIVTALALRDAPAALPVIATWAIYPATDMETRYPSYDRYGDGHFLTRAGLKWFADAYAAELSDWRAAPLKASLAGFPPTLVSTAGLDPLRDQGRAFAGALIAAGVPTIFREARGQIHGYLNLRRAIPSAQGDLLGELAALKPLIVTADAEATMAQAARDPLREPA